MQIDIDIYLFLCEISSFLLIEPSFSFFVFEIYYPVHLLHAFDKKDPFNFFNNNKYIIYINKSFPYKKLGNIIHKDSVNIISFLNFSEHILSTIDKLNPLTDSKSSTFSVCCT